MANNPRKLTSAAEFLAKYQAALVDIGCEEFGEGYSVDAEKLTRALIRAFKLGAESAVIALEEGGYYEILKGKHT